MKRFITSFIIGSFLIGMVFSAYVKVPKNQLKQYRLEPEALNNVDGNDASHTYPITYPNTRNSGTFALIDSSMNGYGMVAANTRPLYVDVDNDLWFAVYRQFCGYPGETHGQMGSAYSYQSNGEDWDIFTNINYNGNPPWGGGGVGGTGVAQGRYPSALGTEDQPLAIWNEYTGDTSTGSLYGGRPYYAYDEFGWDGGSFSYPTDIDLLWDTDAKDLWVGSAAVSQADDGMYVVNVVYNDWTRGDRYLFHSEAYEDGYVVFGTEQKVIDEVADLVGGDDTGSFNTSPYISFTPDGLGMVGLIGLFLGADADASAVSNYHTGIFRLSDDHGASWYGGTSGDVSIGHASNNPSGLDYYFIPDNVWDDLVSTFPESIDDECEGTTHILDSFWSYYEDDMKVDIEGNPHFVVQVLPCESTEEGFCWYTEEAGLYHFTIDRDHIDNPGPVNSETGWNWSFVMRGDATWSFSDLTGDTYIWNNSSNLAFSKDDPNVVYVATNMATPGAAADPSVFDDPCYVTTMNDYPEWSEDIYVIKSEDGGSTWWNPLNVSNTPDETGGICPSGLPKCDPAETYPHTAQWGTDDEVYIMYQMPVWSVNDIGDLLGADFLNRVYAGTAVADDSNIPDYDFGSSCYGEPGDVTGDGIINVLDIVGLVNHILGLQLLDDTCAADYTGDTIVNVLDIVGLVNQILGIGRIDTNDDATYANINYNNSNLSVESDGCIQGVQLTLTHERNIDIDLEDYIVSDYNTIGNETVVLVVAGQSKSCVSEIGSINGDFEIKDVVLSNAHGDQVDGNNNLPVAVDFKVKVAGPNPFNPSTTLNVVVPSDGFVSVKIYNIVGQEVANLAEGFMNQNLDGYNLNWNASNLSSGVYLVRAESAGQVSFEKLMLLK